MASFNHYFANHFSSCRLLAKAYDHCRLRDVKIYQVPGHIEFVGVTDGTDCWIAPVSAELFTLNILQLMRDLSDGKDIKLPLVASNVLKEGPRTRRKLLEDQTPRTRRAIII